MSRTCTWLEPSTGVSTAVPDMLNSSLPSKLKLWAETHLKPACCLGFVNYLNIPLRLTTQMCAGRAADACIQDAGCVWDGDTNTCQQFSSTELYNNLAQRGLSACDATWCPGTDTCRVTLIDACASHTVPSDSVLVRSVAPLRSAAFTGPIDAWDVRGEFPYCACALPPAALLSELKTENYVSIDEVEALYDVARGEGNLGPLHCWFTPCSTLAANPRNITRAAITVDARCPSLVACDMIRPTLRAVNSAVVDSDVFTQQCGSVSKYTLTPAELQTVKQFEITRAVLNYIVLVCAALFVWSVLVWGVIGVALAFTPTAVDSVKTRARR